MDGSTTLHRLTAALLTPVGRGAVATVRVCGAIAALDDVAVPLFRAANGRPFAEQELRRIAFGRWGRESVEEVVVCRLSDDMLEIHCHGGDAAVRRILDDLERADCRVTTWQAQDVTRGEAFHAECLEALSRATTWRTAEILLEQANGLLREAFESLLSCPLAPRLGGERVGARGANGESASDAQQTSSSDSRLSTLDSRPTESPPHPSPLPTEPVREDKPKTLDRLLEWADFGLHLTRPRSVVLTGRPNVGKSSLINRLLGYERAIVFDQPGTTRDVVTGETALDGWPVLLCDTAGVRDTTEELEAAGIALARQRLDTADLHLVLIDLGERPTPDDERLLAEWPDAIVVAHKCDRPDQWQSACPAEALRVSSTTGEGLAALQQRLIDRLVPRVPPVGTPIPISSRQVELLEQAKAALSANEEDLFADIVTRLLDGSDG